MTNTNSKSNSQLPVMATRQIALPIFCDDSEMTVEVLETLYQVSSPFQEILIVNTKEFGKCLIIDGVMQSAESDHDKYDIELLNRLKKRDKNVLVLGGGDGFIAETALQINPKLSITVVDLDSDVMRGVKEAFSQKVFDDSRVKLIIGEAAHYLKTTTNLYDGIVCDLTDAPIGTHKEQGEFEEFFDEIISLSKVVLNPNGWISIQGGATATSANFIDEASIIEKVLLKYFDRVTKRSITIPSYGEPCAFLFAKNSVE